MDHLELTACAAYSNQAYTESDFGLGVSRKYENRFTSTTFFWREHDDSHYIIWRGSQQPRDFLIDICAIPVRYLGEWVHGGFALSHKSVKKKLQKILTIIERSGKPLVNTGHSLGAAQSELTHLLAVKKFPKIESRLVAFGKPRGFLKPAKLRFPPGSVMSCVSGSDVVTRLPRFLYTVGSSDQDMFYLANDGANYLNAEPAFVRRDFEIGDAVSDHSMTVYLQRLKEIS